MAWIRTPSPSRGDRELAAAYAYMREVGGSPLVGRIIRVFSLRPASMRRMIRTFELAMWSGAEPRASRELLAAVLSRLNQCVY